MKLLCVFVAVLAVVNGQSTEFAYKEGGAADIHVMNKYVLTQANSLQPEWKDATTEISNEMLGGKFTDVFEGGTTDYKDEVVNMTPYVRQTKDQRWEAGVPNYEAPEEGYFIRTFEGGPAGETEARAWVLDKTGSKNSINYPLAPDVDPEENLANPTNLEDNNANTMQDNVPRKPPVRQVGHLEPAYVGEYTEDEIFGDTIEGHHEAQRTRKGDPTLGNEDTSSDELAASTARGDKADAIDDDQASGKGSGNQDEATTGTEDTSSDELAAKAAAGKSFIQKRMKRMRRTRH